MGVHRKSRVAIIVSLCYATHAGAAGIDDPCASLAGEVSFQAARAPFWPLRLEPGAAGAGKIHKIHKTICGPAPPAGFCIARACPAPALHPHLIHLAARNCNRPFRLGTSKHG